MRNVYLSILLATACWAGMGKAVAAERITVDTITGAKIVPLDGAKRRATVLIYITNDCPIANACAPEIERIYRAYAPKRVATYLVYVDGSLSPVEARSHHKAYGYTCPAVLDPEHRLVKAGHAVVTPEAAVFAPDGRLLYHGRIDDRAVAFGQVRAQPLRRDLRLALDALLNHRPIPRPPAPAVGCSISDLARK